LEARRKSPFVYHGFTEWRLFAYDGFSNWRRNSFFDINYNGSVAVSRNGNRLAFEEMLPLDRYGLFISDLDGSNRKLLVDGDPYVVTIPVWSPDGNWVIASVHDSSQISIPDLVLALVEINTCQIVPLSNRTGYATSWLS
jgi:Tol biopolymer transport system component